jgi:nucleotide-binding universal stress UspA family protein
MSSKSIVCGVDASDDAGDVVLVASMMASRLGDRLVIAHVAELAWTQPSYAGRGVPVMSTASADIDAIESAAHRLIENIVDERQLSEVDERVEFGVPAEQLAEIADQEEAELIVVGSRGPGSFKAAFLGRVSHELIGLARCPVLVVPPGTGGRVISRL